MCAAPHQPSKEATETFCHQLWDVLISRVPLSRDGVALGCTCTSAVHALRRHFAALRCDFSRGLEPRGPIPVLVPEPARAPGDGGPGSSPPAPCPLPLDFTYLAPTASDAAASSSVSGPRASRGRGTAGDGAAGCDRSCVCCCCGDGEGVEDDAGGEDDGVEGANEDGASGGNPAAAVRTLGSAVSAVGGTAGGAGSHGCEVGDVKAAAAGEAAPARNPNGGAEGCPNGGAEGCPNGRSDGSAGGCRTSHSPARRRHVTSVTAEEGHHACGCGVVVPYGRPAYDSRTGDLLCPPGENDPWVDLRGSAAYLVECGTACACDVMAPSPRTSPTSCSFSPSCHSQQSKATGIGGWSLRGCGGAAGRGLGGCPWRLTQRGLSVRAALRAVPGKGWGVVALEPLPPGRFVCCYDGEYVTTAEAHTRLRSYDLAGRGHALLAVREVLPSGLALRINVDATRVGNIARFFNHSCDGGNMEMVLVRRRGSWLPAVALFTWRGVSEGEELTFAYGPPSAGPVGPGKQSAGGGVAAKKDGKGAKGASGGGEIPPGPIASDPGDPRVMARDHTIRPPAQYHTNPGEGAEGENRGEGHSDGGKSCDGEAAVVGRRQPRCFCGTSACLGYMPCEDV